MEGTVNLGGGPLITAGGRSDIFLAKYSGADGRYLWSQRFGGTWNEAGYGLATDASGDVVIVGTFGETVDFGGGPLLSAGGDFFYGDVFIAKYSGTDGAHLWSRRIGGANADVAYGVALDPLGDIVVTGSCSSSLDFGGGAVTGGTDIFVAKYAGLDGGYLWARRFGGPNPAMGYGVAADERGDVYVSGYFTNGVDLGGAWTPSIGSEMFVAEYLGIDGRFRWSRTYPGAAPGLSDDTPGMGIAVEPGGTLVLTATCWGGVTDVNFGGLTLACSGPVGTPLFLARLWTADGAHVASQSVGGYAEHPGIALDAAGDAIVAAQIDFSSSLAPGVGRYAPDGSVRWASAVGGYGRAVAVAPSGEIAVVGSFGGSVDFGGGAVTSAGPSDLFVLRLGP